MKKFFPISLILILIFSFSVYIPNVKAQESDEFGNATIPDVGFLNWTKFWKLFNDHSAWDLEYHDGLEWVSVKSDLQIIKDYRFNGEIPTEKEYASSCKITLNFTASYNADYRLTFGIDLDVKNYTHKENSWNYTLSYKNYTVYFDWSDVKNLPLDDIKHGVKPIGDESWFWFRIRKNNVPQGYNVVIDPSFGHTDADGSAYSFINRIFACTGSEFVASSDGTLDSITAYIDDDRTGTPQKACAVIYFSNYTYVGKSDEETANMGGTPHWHQFDVSESINIYNGEQYLLGVWASSTSSTCVAFYSSGTQTMMHDSETYDYTPPEPLNPDGGPWNNYDASIYANYSTEAGEEENFFGSVACQFSIDHESSWSVDREGSVSSQLSLGHETTKSFSRWGSVQQSFSIDSSRAWAFSGFGSVSIGFIIDSEKAVSFELMVSILESFIIDDERSWRFEIYGVVSLDLEVDSWHHYYSNLINLFSEILLSLGINGVFDYTVPSPPVSPVGPGGGGLILFILKLVGSPISECKIEIYSVDGFYVSIVTNEKGEAEAYLNYGEYKYRTVFDGIKKEGNFTYQGYTIIRVNFEKPVFGLHVFIIQVVIAVCIGVVGLVGIKKVSKK